MPLLVFLSRHSISGEVGSLKSAFGGGFRVPRARAVGVLVRMESLLASSTDRVPNNTHPSADPSARKQYSPPSACNPVRNPTVATCRQPWGLGPRQQCNVLVHAARRCSVRYQTK
jgi:hypothetical protein